MTKKLWICLPLLLGGCAMFHGPKVTPLDLASAIHAGMSPDTVRKTLGDPARTEMSGSNTVWHYCQTQPAEHEFTGIIFYNDHVVEIRHYTVPRRPEDQGCAARMQPMIKPPK